MDNKTVGGLIAGAIVLFAAIVGAAFNLSSAVRRRRRLRAWALSMGLSFDPSKDHKFDKRFSDLKCLCRGVGHYAYNAMKGQWKDRPILAFDYHYQDGNAEYNFSAVIITSPIPLKPLYIRPERAVYRLMDFFGLEDINFESAEFSRKFYVKSPDRQWAYDVIHQRMIEYLLPIPEFGIQFGSKYVIAWRRWRFKPDTFKVAAELIRGILDRLPEYVVQQQKGETPS